MPVPAPRFDPPAIVDPHACREPEGAGYETGTRGVPALSKLPASLERPAPVHHSAPDRPRPNAVEDAFLQADRLALSLRGALERTTVPLARAAAALIAAQAWCDFGFARLDDYARERLGRSGRWVRDLAALGGRLVTLPRLAAAVTGHAGSRPLGRVAALLVAKVATSDTLDAWIARARELSIRALRDEIRAARAASAIDDAPAAESDCTLAVPPDAAPDPAPHAAPTATPDTNDDPADRLLVRMMLPAPILAAFDEAVDLFRAVEGGEASIASFVEALIAESGGGADGDAAAAGHEAAASRSPRDADLRILRAGPAIAAVERALAVSTGNWSHLPEHAEPSWALSLAGVTLARFQALAAEAGRGAPADLDRQLRALVDIENELESRLGALLADLADGRAWSRLRFAGVGHYGEERLGLSRTTAEDRARLARDLRHHPRLREAYAAGRISREAAAIVARILRDAASPAGTSTDIALPAATRATLEAAWVERAAEATIKRMRDEARALGRYRVLGTPRPTPALGPPRSRPSLDNATPAAGVHPAPPASLMRHPADAPLDDAAWHASLRREPGLARRRVRAFGRLALTSPDVFQALPLESDAFLRLRLPLDLGHQFLATVEAECRRLTSEADALVWEDGTDGPSPDSDPRASAHDAAAPNAAANSASAGPDLLPAPSRLAARMFSIRCRRLPAWVGLVSLLEDFVDTWDDERGMPRRPGDEIYIRDGWRCAAPGCTSRRNLEDHHVRYRSRRGGDELSNRTCLCRFHHQRGEHGGLASCRGRAPTGLLWRLGRNGPGTAAWYRNERRVPEPARA